MIYKAPKSQKESRRIGMIDARWQKRLTVKRRPILAGQVIWLFRQKDFMKK